MVFIASSEKFAEKKGGLKNNNLVMIIVLLISCVFSLDCTHGGIDYSFLTKPEYDPYQITYQDMNLFVNICGNILFQGTSDQAAIASSSQHPKMNLGDASTMTIKSNGENVLFSYTKGSQCMKDITKKYTTTVVVKCNKEKEDLELSVSNFNGCDVTLQLEGKSVCKAGGMSTTTIVFIVAACIVVLVIFILITLTIINFIRGKRGLNAIPIVSWFNVQNSGEFSNPN